LVRAISKQAIVIQQLETTKSRMRDETVDNMETANPSRRYLTQATMLPAATAKLRHYKANTYK
jgi:hypothetical protein